MESIPGGAAAPEVSISPDISQPETPSWNEQPFVSPPSYTEVPPLEVLTPAEINPTQWLGRVLVEPELETSKTLQRTDPKEKSSWHPYMLEEGWEKDLMEFGCVLVEVAADQLLPLDIPHSALTKGTGTDVPQPSWLSVLYDRYR
jgi:hypothetical protein